MSIPRQKVRQQTFTLILSPYKKQVEEKFKLKTASAKLTEQESKLESEAEANTEKKTEKAKASGIVEDNTL